MGGSGGVAPLFLNLVTRWNECLDSRPGNFTPNPLEWELVWATGPVRTNPK